MKEKRNRPYICKSVAANIHILMPYDVGYFRLYSGMITSVYIDYGTVRIAYVTLA